MYKIYEFDGTWFSSVIVKHKTLSSLQEVKDLLLNKKKRYETTYGYNKPFKFQFFIVECSSYNNKVVKSILNINDLENWKEF
jgi:hypothetical protein